MSNKIRVGVIGASISGLVSAYVLAKAGVDVVLYEKESHLLAKTFTINDIDLDLSLMAFNRVTSPNMMDFFEMLGLDMEISDMSFSLSLDEYERSNRNSLSSLFSQKKNVLNPYFLKMIQEITMFKNDVLRYIEHNQDTNNETLGDFIKSHEYSELFQKAYLVPISSSLWPCPVQGFMRLSAFSVLSYFYNHHLFQLFNIPQWFTLRHGTQTFVKKVREELESRGCQIRMGCVVQSITKVNDGGCLVICEDGSQEMFYGCIIDVDAPETLRILGEQATNEEKRILNAFDYVFKQKSNAPKPDSMECIKLCWSKDNKASLTYWLNVLQVVFSRLGNVVAFEDPYKCTVV